jgi:hypothetical protein
VAENKPVKIRNKYLAYCSETGRAAGDVYVTSAVTEALALSGKLAAGEIAPFVYIGGSTYVVSEAVAYLR